MRSYAQKEPPASQWMRRLGWGGHGRENCGKSAILVAGYPRSATDAENANFHKNMRFHGELFRLMVGCANKGGVVASLSPATGD